MRIIILMLIFLMMPSICFPSEITREETEGIYQSKRLFQEGRTGNVTADDWTIKIVCFTNAEEEARTIINDITALLYATDFVYEGTEIHHEVLSEDQMKLSEKGNTLNIIIYKEYFPGEMTVHVYMKVYSGKGNIIYEKKTSGIYRTRFSLDKGKYSLFNKTDSVKLTRKLMKDFIRANPRKFDVKKNIIDRPEFNPHIFKYYLWEPMEDPVKISFDRLPDGRLKLRRSNIADKSFVTAVPDF